MKKSKKIIECVILVLIVLLLMVFKNYNGYKSAHDLPHFKIKDNGNVKQFAMYVKEGADYKPYDSDTFPVGHVLNMDRSFCADINGQKIDGALSGTANSITVTTSKTAYCTLYFDKLQAVMLTYDPVKSHTECVEVQCALDELYGLLR